MDISDRRLMMEIARRLEIVEKKMSIDPQALIPSPIKDVVMPGIPGVTQTIEHNDVGKRLKLEVKFLGSDLLPYEQRMKKCEAFLAELEDIFREYGIVKLSGNYDLHGTLRT